MNVTLKTLTAGVLFFTGHAIMAQEAKNDTLPKGKEKEIETVVILGYGKKSTKAKSTAASTTISSETFENRPSTSFLNSVQGSAPGISINSRSGSPGSGKINVRVRGIGSLAASTDPLYVIDGIMSTGTEYRNLNQNDIESISILRDAQATAIYGNYGANGVFVITTKGGKFNSGLRISYDVTTNFSRLPKHKYNLLSGKEQLLVQNRMGSGVGSRMTLDEINNFQTNTDWGKEFFKTSFTQNHNLGLRYGGKNFAGYTSLGYLDNEGILKNTDFKRFTFRTNVNGRSSNRKLSYSTQIALGYSKRNQIASETNDRISNNTVQNPLLGAVTGAAYTPVFVGNGRDLYRKYGFGALRDGKNVLVLADVVNGGVLGKYTQTSVSVNGNISYEFVDGLTLSNKSGINYKNNIINAARHPNGFLAVAVADQSKTEYGGSESFSHIHDTTFNSVTSLVFDKKFGNHSINAGAYIDYLRGFYSSTSQTQNGLDPLNWVLGAGTGYIPFNAAKPNQYKPSISADKVKAGTLAYIGTVDYDFDSRYGVSGTIRRDGSYRFAEGKKWDTFWSVAGRWNIDKESFMDGSIFNTLKLRASYGINGNQNLVSSAINTNPLFISANLVRDTYETVTGYQGLSGYGTSLKNTELEWEKSSQANIGLDFALFNRKLEGTFDVYNKKITDMYLNTPISGANGTYTIKGNAGEMKNTGIEASLRYTPFKGDFRLSVYANLGYNKNKIVSLVSEDLSGDLVHKVGGPAYQWQLYRYVGVNKDNGNYLFLDKNGNITEQPTDKDRVLTGKQAYAPYNGGFGFDIDYKGFYLSTAFSFQAGGWAYDNMHFWLNRTSFISSGHNGTTELLNAWTPQNKNASVGSLKASNVDLLGSSDKYLRKTDYIRLKNVSIGYNVNKNLLRNLPIKALKVYAMGENLLTFTKWKGFDPETALGGSLGVYPNSITYSLGLNVEF